MQHDFEIGYCGNVHPALSVDQVLANIRQHAASVRNTCYPDSTLPFGIWVSKTALDELADRDNQQRLHESLLKHHIRPFTINGFPFGDFHQSVVKHSVYQPDWTSDRRLNYTLKLAELHDRLLPPGKRSTISTLPLGWPHRNGKRLCYAGKRLPLTEKSTTNFLRDCADQLLACARTLAALKEQTGRHCTVCLEPEPGCVLDTADDVVQFFEEYLCAGSDTDTVRSHIGICHDICHSAVMFEDQADAIAAYQRHGITVGKIQVSSAVEVAFTDGDEQRNWDALHALKAFSEPRYLHQTTVKRAEEVLFYQDLGEALEAHPVPTGIWRIHFHVPIFASSFGPIGTTQASIGQCIDALNAGSNWHSQGFHCPHHFEIETYAWNVLPAAHRSGDLATDIAKEISWFRNLLDSR